MPEKKNTSDQSSKPNAKKNVLDLPLEVFEQITDYLGGPQRPVPTGYVNREQRLEELYNFAVALFKSSSTGSRITRETATESTGVAISEEQQERKWKNGFIEIMLNPEKISFYQDQERNRMAKQLFASVLQAWNKEVLHAIYFDNLDALVMYQPINIPANLEKCIRHSFLSLPNMGAVLFMTIQQQIINFTGGMKNLHKNSVTIQQNIFKKHLTRFFDGKSDSIGYRRTAV
jgi:hypothetical protein